MLCDYLQVGARFCAYMGAAIFVFFMLFLLGAGLSCIIGGIVGLLVLRKRSPKHKKAFAIVLWLVLIFGILATLLPLGFFGFIVYVNSAPPESFVQTEITIEEDGYQDTAFTADGTTYVVQDLRANYRFCRENAVPVFSYQTEGFLRGSQCGNYYAVENEQGFDLIWDGHALLFCPVEQAEAVSSFYQQTDTVWYQIHAEGDPVQLDPEISAAVDEIFADVVVQIPDPDRELWFQEYSADGIVEYNNLTILITGGQAYAVADSEVTADRGLIQYGVLLPEEIGALFLTLQ